MEGLKNMKSDEMINDCLDYIEENISEQLSLELLADNFYISKYHFHRIFLASMGNSIMSYIRRRRVVRASYELMYSDNNITYIALDFGFNSLDGFSRAFKRIYGISPYEYRKIKGYSKFNYTHKGENYMKNLNISGIIKCSQEEKRECLDTLDKILEVSRKAHKRGLLALEDDACIISNKFFRKGLELLLYGMEPLALREILENYIIVGNYNGKELLERVLILEGILSIQMGDYPWVIREKLIPYFGENYLEEINSHFGIQKNTEVRIKSYINLIKDNQSYSTETTILDNELKKMPKRSIQRLLRDVDILVLSIGMKGASGETQIKIIEGLSMMTKSILIELLDLMDNVNIAQIVDAQNRIAGIIKKLRVEGEIM